MAQISKPWHLVIWIDHEIAHLYAETRGGVEEIATILAGGQETFRYLTVACRTAELVDHLAVPLEFKPLQAVQNGCDRGVGRPLPVGVLDPKQHFAAMLAGEEPVEQGGAGSSDMEEAGRRGGKACDDLCGH